MYSVLERWADGRAYLQLRRSQRPCENFATVNFVVLYRYPKKHTHTRQRMPNIAPSFVPLFPSVTAPFSAAAYSSRQGRAHGFRASLHNSNFLISGIEISAREFRQISKLIDMNFTHVLSLGSSLSSSALRKALERGYGVESRVDYRPAGLHCISCRSSNGEERRSYGEGRRSGNGVTDRPTYGREQNSGYRSSGGSRGNSRGGYGGSRSSGKYRSGDYSRFKGSHGRNRKKQMHPGAYTMVDELTGEKVVVWGVETDDEIPVPTAEDLQWKKTIIALPGDASDDVWAKVIEDSGYDDNYSVKGVEQGGTDWIDDLYDEDLDDDEEDEDFDGDDSYDTVEADSDYIAAEEVVRVETTRKVSRAPRLKVFGRDVRGKSLLKVQTPSKEEDGSPSVNEKKVEDEPGAVEHSVNDLEDVNGDTYDVHLSQESSPTRSGGFTIGKVGKVSDEHSFIDLEEVFNNSSETTAGDIEKIYLTNENTDAAEDSFQPSSSSPKISDAKYTAKDSYKRDAIQSPTADRDVNPERMRGASKEEYRAAPGAYYIVDVTDERRSVTKQKNEAREGRKGSLLDQLRLQATGKMPMSKDRPERGSSEDGESFPQSKKESNQSKEAVDAPFPNTLLRDLKARDNYDASIAEEFFSQKNFRDIGATDEVIRALASLQVDKPSQIQALSFTPIIEGKSCILAEQTGSGKTLAYVAPLVQRLRADEAAGMGKALPKKPRILVLVPTSELAAQVLKNFRALSKGGVPTRSIVLTGGFKWKTQVENLQEAADVVIATPGRLLQHLEAGTIQFDHVKSVVFDEVDILFDDEEFSKALQTINKTASIKVQYVHVTATLPVDVHDDLLERYPDCLSLMGPSLHRTAPGLQEILVDCSGGEIDEKTPESAFVNKRTALLQLVNEKPVSKTIIFCNKIETCRKVENILTRYDRTGKKIQVLPYHAALSQEARLENLETFMAAQPKLRTFLVCTDRASRGIDSLDVEHVVLFDFPRDPSEYVRRVGRTARGAGGTGKVFVLAVGKQVSAARRIMERNDKGYPIHDVPGDRYYYSN
ncbi:hypothetical protein R1flu_028217 [Riccia fluitans]|uniref:RNA helicase n=1 Tax=Riccia fluitans TaxID=41844 RepID=A0ABD1XLI5_9MARC